ncbi:MAG: hypothetical protein Q4F49_05225 [Pseudoxanthomonas suwonensis]|nr:hypothetical protein [Pseudoxanthomonas suwonensis]
MRKQYHSRPGPDGRLIWDVDRLVALTHGLTPEWIQLADIGELDETWWYDAEGDRPTCRSLVGHFRLMQEADLAYPIIVCPDGRVMDGMHRVTKALLEGREAIQAYRLPTLPPPDHVGVALEDLPYD